MSRLCSALMVAALAAVMVPAAAGAQTFTETVAEPAALPPPMSITQRYVPVKAPRAPLALLIEDSPVVASNAEMAEGPQQPVVVEEVGDRPAIAALAPGRLAITVSSQPVPTQRVSGSALFQRGQVPPSRR